jgi:DNA-binding GntR family transcriptional regulator
VSEAEDDARASTSVVDAVYGALQTAIVEGRLGAGTPLSQNKVAGQLGVSRTPVRDALLRLERDGLVERLPDVGYVVAGITPVEVDELCDLIALLDTYVYTRAAAALSDAELRDLRDLAGRMVGSAEAEDLDGWIAADEAFHAAVMAAARNRVVADALTRARQRVQRFGVPRSTAGGRLVTCSLDHMALADAMAGRDAAALSELVAAHIDRTRASVQRRLAEAAPLLPRRDALSGVTARGGGEATAD